MEPVLNIYVGNLPAKVGEWQIRKAFSRYGKVDKIIMNEQQSEGNPYGFCFIEMPFENQASHAIKELNGTKLAGSVLSIRESGVGA